MAKYGNIMTVFNCKDNKKQKIKAMLSKKGANYENKEGVFFIESKSKIKTTEIIQGIKLLNVEFIFFHNHNSKGSVIRSFGINTNNIKKINELLFR